MQGDFLTHKIWSLCPKLIKKKFQKSSNRSKDALKNIIMSVLAKIISIVAQLMVIPLTIHYLNPTRYGIWLTLASIISWISFFDLGLGNGFRNRFAEAKANGDYVLAKQYVSTSYAVLSTIMLFAFIVIQIVNLFLDWTSILNVDKSYCEELRDVFAVLSLFFCFSIVVKLLSTLLIADQKNGLASLLNASGQVLSLFSIWVLTKTTEGSLLNLALFYSSVPTLIIAACSFYVYNFTRYKEYAPSIKLVNFSLTKKILGLGLQFFVIYLCMLLIFQIINIVISREFGPEIVTEYNIAYKYFSISHLVIAIILSPFWSAFTDAYNKQDYAWMKNVKRKLEIIWMISIIVIFIMLCLSNWFYKIWIGNNLHINESLSIGITIFIIINNIAGIYITLINGIGKVRIQLCIYIIVAIFSYPLMIYCSHIWGVTGVLVPPILLVFLQAIFANIQLSKILDKKSTGIWNR